MKMTYDTNNIFAKILRGEIPCHKIYEDATALAFMDVMPRVAGHCLVITKSPSRNLIDANPEELGALMGVVQRVAAAAMAATGADGFQIRQYNEAVAGQTVFHLHIHVLPMKAGDTMMPHAGKMADSAILAGQAADIRSKLATLP
jgi:histidine triad (HIT) family protein